MCLYLCVFVCLCVCVCMYGSLDYDKSERADLTQDPWTKIKVKRLDKEPPPKAISGVGTGISRNSFHTLICPFKSINDLCQSWMSHATLVGKVTSHIFDYEFSFDYEGSGAV